MSHKTVDPAEIVSEWDNGGVVEELTTDQTVAAIAKSLKVPVDIVRQILLDAGRIE